jgi:hypothetical protein
MLVNTDDGGPGEVYHVMEKAPISWGPILVLDNVPNTMILYTKVVEHEQALVNAAQNEHVHSRALTVENLGAALKSFGYLSKGPLPGKASSPNSARGSGRKHFNTHRGRRHRNGGHLGG